MIMSPVISVIVPIYNSERTLDRCVLSVVNQTIRDEWELLLIDDGSSDNSVALCKKYATKDSRIRVIEGEHKGISHARNVGIEYSTGQYISFLDSDDYMEPEMLEVLFEAITGNPSVDMAVTSYSVIRNGVKISEGSLYDLTGKIVYPHEIDCVLKHYYSSTENIPCYVTNILYKKETVQQFDEQIQFMEDAEFLARQFIASKGIAFTYSHLYNHTDNDSGITRDTSKIYSNTMSVVNAGKKISNVLINNSHEDKDLREMLCHSIVNRLLMIKTLDFKEARNLVKTIINEKEVQLLFKDVNTDRMSTRMKLVSKMIKHGMARLLTVAIKLK